MNNTLIVTNATNGAITRVTQFHTVNERDQLLVFLAVMAVIATGLGLYLLFRKKAEMTPILRPKRVATHLNF